MPSTSMPSSSIFQRAFSRRLTVSILVFISIMSIVSFSSFVNFSYGLTATPGDTFVWEKGNDKSATGYVEATLVFIENNTVYVDYLGYDIIGELDVSYTNKSGGFLWVDPADFPNWLSNGYATENITHLPLDIDFECIIRVREYDNTVTTEYYDMESGLLVESTTNFGDYIKLIATEDIDVKQYVEDQGMGISFAPLGSILMVCFLVIGVIYKRQKHLTII
ncbi:MAG: hypothetical protein ACTSYI_03665 [Promethearchaeota archaeon]